MEEYEQELTLRDYLAILKRRYLVVVIAVVAATLLALALSLSTTPIYQAEAKIVVSTKNTDSLFDTGVNLSGSDATRAVQTEIEVMEGEVIRQRVIENLNLAEVPPPVNASVVGSTDVLSVKVRSVNANVSATLANAYVDAYIENRRQVAIDDLLAATAEVQAQISELGRIINELEPDDPSRQKLLDQQATFQQTVNQLQIDTALKSGGASIVQSAEPPETPVEPTPLRTSVLAAVVGLLVGLGAAFALDYFDDSVHSEEDLERAARRSVLASVPPTASPSHLPISITKPDQAAAEAYRGLRTNIQFLSLDKEMRTLLVTSCTAGEGKTTTATNLAVVLAQAGRRVALIDADLRRPRVHEVFGIDPQPGLVDAIVEGAVPGVRRRVQLPTDETFEMIPAGLPPTNPGELLVGNRIIDVINALLEEHDHVIVDSAPILPVADSLAVAGRVDGVLLVADAKKARRTNVTEAVERLERVGSNIVGLVYNNAKESSASLGAYGYSYGYGYGNAYRQKSDDAKPEPTKPVDDTGEIEMVDSAEIDATAELKITPATGIEIPSGGNVEHAPDNGAVALDNGAETSENSVLERRRRERGDEDADLWAERK